MGAWLHFLALRLRTPAGEPVVWLVKAVWHKQGLALAALHPQRPHNHPPAKNRKTNGLLASYAQGNLVSHHSLAKTIAESGKAGNRAVFDARWLTALDSYGVCGQTVFVFTVQGLSCHVVSTGLLPRTQQVSDALGAVFMVCS